MKKHLLFLRLAVCALLAPFAAHAAEFEGTLQWTFKAEITDPAMKAQMEQAGREMADPEKLAEMKAMLDSPQMKAMMEQNPQLKAAMEARVKMAEDAVAGKGGDMMSRMMPQGMTLRTKAGRTNMVVEGGPMPMEIIGRDTPPEATLIDRKERTFSRMPAGEAKSKAEQAGHSVIKLGETTKVLGRTCEKYLVETTQEGQKMAGVIWATKDIPGLNSTALARASVGGEDAYLEEIDGVPLRMEMNTPRMTIHMEATAIRAGSIADDVFEIPAGFTETPFAFGGPKE